MRVCAVLPLVPAALLAALVAAAPALAGEGEVPPVRWMQGFGVGFRAGGAFLSEPTNGLEFLGGAAGGAELDWGVLTCGPHRARLAAGFLVFSAAREKGTPEIRVETRYSRVDFAAGYDFTPKLLVLGVDVGLVLALNRVKTVYGEPTWTISDGEIEYHDPEDPETRDRLGAGVGFLAGLSVGVELGELFGFPDLLELRAAADYTLRNMRNEIAVLGLILFWPTAFADNAKEGGQMKKKP